MRKLREKTCRGKAAVKGTWEKVDKAVDFALVISFSFLDGQKGPSLHLRSRSQEQRRNTDVSLCSVTESGQTFCDPVDCGPPGSSAHGILQARIREQFSVSYYRGSSQPRDQTRVSCVSCIGRRVLYH